jgi:hypothetical protein
VFLSGGSCANSNEKFKLIDGKYMPVEFTEWDYATNGERYVCTESTYNVINSKRLLKSKSTSYWDSNKEESVELGIEFY